MALKELEKISKALEKELKKAISIIMQRQGVEKHSDLIKDLEWEYKNNMFVLLAYDYYTYLSEGRKRGTMPPAQDLIPWIKENNLSLNGMTVSQLAFVIARSIKINGIKGKKYSDKVLDISLDLISETLAEDLSGLIAKDIVDALQT